MLAYLRDPAEIYRLSFEIIRCEAPVDRLPEEIRGLALRLIHACGMTDILDDRAFSPDIVAAGRAALAVIAVSQSTGPPRSWPFRSASWALRSRSRR